MKIKYVLKKLLLIIFLIQMGGVFAQKSGVLIMAHGGSEKWNEYVEDAAQSLKENYEVEFAWGMANPVTLQQGVNALEERGVSDIIAVPLFISSYSPIIRQTEYLFGKRDSLADPPMPLMHHSEHYIKMFDMEVDSSNFRHGMLFLSSLQPIKRKSAIELTEALDAHDIVAKILRERVLELSENPSDETVILAAHGPNSESDNAQWINTMEKLIQKIQKIQVQNGKTEFKQIFGVTVRDDAPEPIFNQAKAQLRALVRQAGLSGDVIVVPLFLSSGGRERAVAERLDGLDFRWNGKTLLPHPLLTEFLVNSVKRAKQNEPATEEAKSE